jgi:hypothetical protein
VTACADPSLFDLEDPDMRRWLYPIVLREASRPEDLTGYLDRDTLIGVAGAAPAGRRARIGRGRGPLRMTAWPSR